MTNTNAPFDGWAPFMVVGFKAYETDGTVSHIGDAYTEDGRTLSDVSGDLAWQAVDGLSGQYGYSGPIMHPSENLSEHTVRGLLDGLYQCVVVTYIGPCEDHGDDWEACEGSSCDTAPEEGWALMRYVGPQDNNSNSN